MPPRSSKPAVPRRKRFVTAEEARRLFTRFYHQATRGTSRAEEIDLHTKTRAFKKNPRRKGPWKKGKVPPHLKKYLFK